MVLDMEIARDIRRGILWCLKAVSGHKLNDRVLLIELRQGGYELRLSQVRDHLRYLAKNDKGYILLKYNEDADMYIAEITGRGRDLVDGMIFDPGVSDAGKAGF